MLCSPASLPGKQRHDSVVDNVEGGDVVVLLAQDEEECVEELGKLGEVVPPCGVGHANRQWVVRGVQGLAEEVVAQPASRQNLVENPGAEHNLGMEQTRTKLLEKAWLFFPTILLGNFVLKLLAKNLKKKNILIKF